VLIDWFTVGAQAINFLILVWLLKRYLYQPVLAAIDARAQKVAGLVAGAATQESKARAATEDLRQRREGFDREREHLLQKAADDAATEGQALRASARADDQLLRSKLTLALATERAELGRQLSTRAQAEVFAMTRRALSDLADTSLEDRMVDVFIVRLAGVASHGGDAISALDPTPVRVALVRSAFELSSVGRAKLEAAVNQHLGAQVVIRFAIAAELICGIELIVDGVKLAWSVSNYLSTLAQDVAATAASAFASESSAIPIPVSSSLPISPIVQEIAHAG
jgi:F-type H+-transporting ATPase subunit b